MSAYAVGNQVECLFAFTSRALTAEEQATFQSGGGLPSGAGVDQVVVKFDYRVNNGPTTTLTLALGGVVHDANGAYHALIPASVAGTYEWRGYSQDGSGNAVASTTAQTFLTLPF